MKRTAFADTAQAGAGVSAHVQEYSPEELKYRAMERRAVEAVNWGIPAVNYHRMVQATVEAGAGFNQIVYWSGLPGWQNQSLTPNPDVIYLMPFLNTRDVGPMVLEIPPAQGGVINGTLMDCWQGALEDVGLAGADEGKGGKYLILPPDFKDKAPEGYFVLRPAYYQTYALLRSLLEEENQAGIARAVAYAQKIKLYPLSAAANPEATTFLDVQGKLFDSTIRYDLSFFRSLDRMVQSEPWSNRDKIMIDMLKLIGIEKGKPFQPDTRMRDLMQAAAWEARAWFDARFESDFPSYYDDSHWVLGAVPEAIETMGTFFEKPDGYAVDGRGLTYFYAFSSNKQLGAGQFYLFAFRDRRGQMLDGGKSYHLSVPSQAPVNQYWSAVIYDRATHSFIREAPHAGRSSLTPGLAKNVDGSVELCFGPKAPAGKESNWVPTNPGGKFEVCFRFYGPEKALFDKTWVLPDIERAS